MKPSWLIGNVLKKCGVPCAYEIGMMLAEETDEPVIPDAPSETVYNFLNFGGSYSSGETKRTNFAIGKFPLWQNYSRENIVQSYLDFDLELTDCSEMTTDEGDYVTVRYMLPKATALWYALSQTLGTSHDYIVIYFDLYDASNGRFTAKYNGYQDTFSVHNGGINSWGMILGEELFSDVTYQENRVEGVLVGYEISGRLKAPLTQIDITITFYCESSWSNAKATVTYASNDDLKITVRK